MNKCLFNLMMSGFIFLFNPAMNRNLSAQVSTQDSLALVALYDSTDGANWITNTGWLTGPVSNWFGITVSGERVTEIELRSNNLVGTIPLEIGNLTELVKLDLYSNELTGSIPIEIGNLTNLIELNLHINQLIGNIPAEIGNLTNLQYIYMRSNQLTGPIPPEIGYLMNLKSLYLNRNQLTDPIPPQIGNLINLVNLDLYRNRLTGTIPPEIYNNVNLSHLSLANNELTGSISPDIGKLVNLVTLYLHDNMLTDSIPSEIGSLINLRYLWLNGNQFVGAVPVGIGDMNDLRILRLYNNRLTDLPDISSDTSLTEVQVQNNQFTFEDIEPNIGIEGFIYAPQDRVGQEQDTIISQGSSLVLSVSVDGTANQYQWTKDGVIIQDATDSSYTISTAAVGDNGSYVCKISNTIATELILYSRPINVIVGTGVGISGRSSQTPKTFALKQNYPNPFNPKTIINYELPITNYVELAVYNLLGQKVVTLVNGIQKAGNHQVEFKGQNLSSGIYMYRIEIKDPATRTGVWQDVNKMILMR